MIIVSQDRSVIVNFDNVECIGIGNLLGKAKGVFSILCNTTNIQYKIGCYRAEERAKEVLEEIYNFYEVTQRYGCSSYNGINIFLEKKFVYEMPEE